MYNTSTQKKYWLFANVEELEERRVKANEEYRQRHSELKEYFLTPQDENYYIKHNLVILMDVCKKFQPPMLKSVIATAFQYFKRFYLNNSCMEFLPKNIAVTCAYLACKVEEFNININQFVSNLKGDSARATDTVLSNELLLMEKLNYHLTIHNPFRAIEGLLIDLKTRGDIKFGDAEQLRPHIDEYVERVMFTDAAFLVTPSQIAMASIIYAARECGVNIDFYLSETFYEADKLNYMRKYVVPTIDNMLASTSIESPSKDVIKSIDKKLKHIQTAINKDEPL